MKPEHRRLLKSLLIYMIVFCLAACAKAPVKMPVEKDRQIDPLPAPVEEKAPEILPEISMLELLSAQAEAFSVQKNFQDALFIYNQALSLADETQKPQLTERIETLLARTPAADIETFSQIKNIHISKALLLYWQGLNYAMEHNPIKSMAALDSFMFQYPDHPYYADAADLVNVIKASLFKRNTIGCLLPMTGKYAVFGQRVLQGIQLAIQELSKTYNRDFKLIIKDTQADPQTAVEAVRQLYQLNVAGIIGPLLTVNPAGMEAQKLGIPMIALTQKNDFPLQGDYLFSNFITPQMQVQTLGAYLFQDLGIKKVAILYPDEKYGRTYMKLFWDLVDEYGGEVVGVEPYDGKKTDFTEPIQKLTGQFYPIPEALIPEIIEPEAIDPERVEPDDTTIELNTDQSAAPAETTPEAEAEEKQEKIQIDFQALFIPDSPSTVGLILPQLAFNDATGMVLVGTNLWHHPSLLKDAKGYTRHTIITDGFFDGSQNPVTAEFTEKFKSLFKKKPKFLEASAYDTASLLYLTAMDETIDSRQTLKDALLTNLDFQGVTGHTRFDENGSAQRQLFLMTIKRGKFVEISR